MAMTQRERDEKAANKRKAAQEEELRMRVRPGTKQALCELMRWSEVEEQGEAVTIMIHRLHELGRDKAAELLQVPRHKIEVSESVAHKLDRERMKRMASVGLLSRDDIELMADLAVEE